MLVGLVTEIKPRERRCALTPAGARELVAAGHDVLVQAGAGDGSGFCDADYVQAGAELAPDAQIEEELERSDVVIGAVLIPGAVAPKLVSREMLGLLPPRAVLVDVAIDQGGCFATSRPTTHADPAYEVDGILHYCVANMPGAVPRSSTRALTNATLPYIRRLADLGLDELCAQDPGVIPGVLVRGGQIVSEPVAA